MKTTLYVLRIQIKIRLIVSNDMRTFLKHIYNMQSCLQYYELYPRVCTPQTPDLRWKIVSNTW